MAEKKTTKKATETKAPVAKKETTAKKTATVKAAKATVAINAENVGFKAGDVIRHWQQQRRLST